MKLRNNEGFTLVELIVVIAIVAALAAIAVPLVSGYVNDAQASTCAGDRDTFIKQFQADRTTALVKGYYDDDAKIVEGVAGKLGVGVEAKADGKACTGLCPGGGSYNITTDGRGGIRVFCMRHNPWGLPYASPGIIEELADVNGVRGKHLVDSTVPADKSNWLWKVLAYFSGEGIDLENENVKYWGIRNNPDDNKKANLYLSDQDITKLAVGTLVRVVKYNEVTEKYTVGYLPVKETYVDKDGNSSNRTYYNVLDDEEGNWVDYRGSAELDSYEDAVELFNNMPVNP